MCILTNGHSYLQDEVDGNVAVSLQDKIQDTRLKPSVSTFALYVYLCEFRAFLV